MLLLPPHVTQPPTPTPPLPYPTSASKGCRSTLTRLGSFPQLRPPSEAPHGQTPLPVAFLTAPTIGALPLTGNSAASLMSSPLRVESRHRAPSSPNSPIGLGPYLSLTLAEPQECLGATPATVRTSPTIDCRRAEFSPLPHRRAASSVSPRPWLLARHIHHSTSVLTPVDIFHLAHQATGGLHATTPRHAQ
jgi:hypothetical protein